MIQIDANLLADRPEADTSDRPARPATPTEALAALVVEELMRQGLLDAAAGQDISAKLAQGSAKQDDWNGWINDLPDEVHEEPSHGAA